MGKGYAGKILFVDLTSGSIEEEILPEAVYRGFLGGEGLGVRILYERMNPKADPLGPENIIGFATGLLTGTPVPMTPRYTVCTKSPLTNAWGQANSGGYFGSELKAAGYDAVFFTGISPEPVYFAIHEGKPELRDAFPLWGKDTVETEEIIRQDLGDRNVRVACIGPAGESVSLISCIMNDKGRAAARCGVGAVMGKKRLKAIAVRGSGRMRIGDQNRLRVLRKGYLKDLRETQDLDFVSRVLKSYGTCGAVRSFVIAGDAPVKNWNLSGLEAFPRVDMISDDSVIKYQVRRFACFGCPTGCGGIVNVDSGPYATSEGHKPEYETLAAFGTMCLNDNVESIIKANDICNRYGLDTISTGAVMAFAIECYERGIIGPRETDGIELAWGNASAILAMLGKMVRHEGFGAVLSDGVKKAAEQIGENALQHAIHLGGQEPGFRDPRFSASRIGYIADAAPGRHTSSTVQATFEKPGILEPYPEFKVAHKEFQDHRDRGKLFAFGNKYQAVVNCTGLCVFAIQMSSVPFPLIEFISAVTGWDYTLEEALATGHRIQTLRQAFTVREGMSPQGISFPERMSKTLSAGPLAGKSWDFEGLRDRFYAAMGWETQGCNAGHPLPATIKELGLDGLIPKGQEESQKATISHSEARHPPKP